MFTRYLGKIQTIVKQDGVFAGISSIFKMAYVLFYVPKKADILFVSSGAVGDSWRYRVKNVAEELELQGISSAIVVQENLWLSGCVDKFKVFIFHRTGNTQKLQKFIEELKRNGKEIIFETDDLLFEPSLVQGQDFYKNANLRMQKFYENGVGTEFVQDEYVKTCTTTTDYLAEKLRAHGKNVFVVPNKLSQKDLEIADKILKTKKAKENNDTIKIGYFSGAHSHNKDFAVITGALMQIMEKYENLELFLVGPLDIENRLNRFADRVKQFPYAKREQHFQNVANVDINIAPLEIENPFCQSKSELKFFEAGIMGVPTVATATDPFKRAIEDGVDGFLASRTHEWNEKLGKLIEDAELRRNMGEKAREKALARYTTINANNEEYYNYLRKHI